MLNKIFVSEVRVKILKLLLLNSQTGYHVRAIVRAVEAEINAVRRELENLYKIGLVTRRQSSNRLYYKANPEHPFFGDLLSLVSKETGLGSKLIKNKKKLGDVEFAVVSLEFLKGRISSALDVDLFIVGKPDLEVLQKIVQGEESKLGREINYSIMDSEDFMARKRTKDQFVVNILSQGKSVLIGDEVKFYSII